MFHLVSFILSIVFTLNVF